MSGGNEGVRAPDYSGLRMSKVHAGEGEPIKETVADKFKPLMGDRPAEGDTFTIPVAAIDVWDLVAEVFELRKALAVAKGEEPPRSDDQSGHA